jgi:hypothetical protein
MFQVADFKVAEFYLLDLERTIGFNRPFFWKGNKHGYTSSLKTAGIFSKAKAEMIVRNDFDQMTVMISQDKLYKILGMDMNPHEGTINIHS